MPVSGESGPNRSHALIRLVVPREQLWNFSANLWSLPLPRQRSHSLNSSESLRSQDTTLPTAVRFYPRGRKLGSSAASAITNADQHRLPQHHLQASATFNKDVLVKSPRRSCVFAILITPYRNALVFGASTARSSDSFAALLYSQGCIARKARTALRSRPTLIRA